MSGTLRVKPKGLTQLYAPRGDPTVDIVFVHGLNGHPKDSWTSKSGCFWPVDLLPETLAPLCPRILTYGYNANVTAFTDGTSRDSIVNHAETLSSNLAANRNLRNCSERPIIFVSHSLGGLVVKRALTHSRSVADERAEHLRSVYVSTFGILFLGTPHTEYDVAKWSLLLHNICSAVLPMKLVKASPQLVEALHKNNETLQYINSQFADIMSRFHICLFHETRSMDVKGTRQIIVDEESAAPCLIGVERMGIEADHSHMCKFEDENAPGYEVLAEAILRYSRQAPTVIADRWVEERKSQALEKKAKFQDIYDRDTPIAHQSRSDFNEYGQSLMALSRANPSDDRKSPVSDLPVAFSFSRSSEPPLFVAPPGFHPNVTFFGMQKELEILHNRLFKAKARIERATSVLISGVAGSGKTHLARQYVFTQRECYPGGVFWVDANSRESLCKCFWEIAQAANLIDRKETKGPGPEHQQSQTYVDDVRNWLQTRHGWLLIFDGILFDHDDDINEFKSFLPLSKRCSIIYTSIDTTLRKKQRLLEPYCLSIPRLQVEDACKILFKDLGIKRPTPQQAAKATELANHYECLPLAIHAIGHRLNASGKPIERYRIKHQMTDRKLAEPFLWIMTDLYRLNQRQALNLINLLSFLGPHIPVGLIKLGSGAMFAENTEILTSPQEGEEPDLDTTLGTLIRYGLIERTSDTGPQDLRSTSTQYSSDAINVDATPSPRIPGLTESITEDSQEYFFLNYRSNSMADNIKIHSVVQQFCRDELRIEDEESKGALSKQNLGFYESWLIVAARFLCKSYEAAKERMAQHHEYGLVRDYREYEIHASRLVELFLRKPKTSAQSPGLREARENLQQLKWSISNEIDRTSPSPSRENYGNQKSVFVRSYSSPSSFSGTSADESLPRMSKWKGTETARAESPEQMRAPPRYGLDLLPPHIFRRAGYESEDDYQTDGEVKETSHTLPVLSQMNQTMQKLKPSSESASPPAPYNDQSWQVIDRHHKTRSPKDISSKKRSIRRRLRGAKPAAPLVKMSPIEGRGSSSRLSTDEGSSYSFLNSAAERALAAVRQSSNSQPVATDTELPDPAPGKKENVPTYADIAVRRTSAAELPPKRSASMAPFREPEPASSGLQMKPSIESLDRQTGHMMSAPLIRSTYSEPGREYPIQPLHESDLHAASEHLHPSLAHTFEPARDLSASTPYLLPHPPVMQDLSANTPSFEANVPPSLYDVDISVTDPLQGMMSQHPTWPICPYSTPNPVPIPHPSAIMPGSLPLQRTISEGSTAPGNQAALALHWYRGSQVDQEERSESENLGGNPYEISSPSRPRAYSDAIDYRTDMHSTQGAGDGFSIRHSGEVSASNLLADATTPEHPEEESIDAGITQSNDLSVVLNAVDYYKKLDDLECEVARLCDIDRSLEVQNRHSSLVECYNSISNYMAALRNLRNEGFCRDSLIILVKDPSRPYVAKAIHVPLSAISNLEESLKGKDCSSFLPSLNFFRLVSELHGVSVPSLAMTGDYVPFVNFLCAVFAIGLVAFSGSHVCRFDISIMGQPLDEIPVGLGDSFRTRNLACLSSFIGGPAWVLGKSEPLAQQEGLKISLTVQDLDELWGPVWLLKGSADEGRIIRTERGYIVPLPRQEQGADTEEIECHWRVECPEWLLSEIDSDDRPLLHPTSRILVGTNTTTEAGLTVNEKCQLNISLKQQCIASRLQLTGTTRSQLVDDGFELSLVGGQYVSAGIVKKWKRMPARTQKSVLIELCQKPNTKLSPLLKARVGLEVSACTGNAQRVTLWDVLRLSQAKAATKGNMDSPEPYCKHMIGDINCINSCWSHSSSIDIDIIERCKPLTVSDARRLIIQSILALEHTGIDGEGNLQAWWPFSESPLTSRISRSTPEESHEWFRVIKDSRDSSSFAVLSQRCLEFGERRCVQKLSGTSRNGSCRMYRTGLYTRVLPVKGVPTSLVQGAKILVGNANLTVEQASQTEGESVIIAAVSANPFRVLGGFLREGRILYVQEHVHHDIPTSLSIPMFAY